MTIEQIAKLCHEANREFCTANGDVSQKPWDESPKWQQESSVAGVKTLIDNPMYNAADCHDAWSKHKRADGWVYGPWKDANAKTHPCLVPHYELPYVQQAKDKIFVAIVRACEPLISK